MVGAPSTITSEECRCVLRVEFLLRTDSGYFLNIGSTSVVGENYEQNGVNEGRGKVRWNRLGGHKMSGLYCGREAEIGRSLRRTKIGVKRSRTKCSGNCIRIVTFFFLFLFYLFIYFFFVARWCLIRVRV